MASPFSLLMTASLLAQTSVLGWLWLLSYCLVFLGLVGYGIHRYAILLLFWKNARNPPKPIGKFRELPLITVQLPLFNELFVVRRLLRSIEALEYPKEKLQIQVIDDSTDETVQICAEEVARMQAQGWDIEHLHRTDRTGYKAGALEAATPKARGEFLFILDADFLPHADVLHQMIHFFTDDRVGMIQTRWGHINRGYSLLTRLQAMFLDGHFTLEQTARCRSGRFFQFNGTAGIWRKECIADAGGWEHDTLTEDMDLSYRAQMRGWRFHFLNDVVTPAELPVDMDGFKSQQHRWTKGSIQVCKKILGTIWRNPNVPLLLKLEATAHLTANFSYLLLGFLFVLMLPMERPEGLSEGMQLAMSLSLGVFCTLSVCAFYISAQLAIDPRSFWKSLLRMPLLLALGLGMSVNNLKAVLEAVFNRESSFVRTPKYGIEGGDSATQAAQQRAQASAKSRYKALRSVALVFELLIGVIFAGLAVVAIMRGMWTSVPFLLLFVFGFLYVGIGSLRNLPVMARIRARWSRKATAGQQVA